MSIIPHICIHGSLTGFGLLSSVQVSKSPKSLVSISIKSRSCFKQVQAYVISLSSQDSPVSRG